MKGTGEPNVNTATVPVPGALGADRGPFVGARYERRGLLAERFVVQAQEARVDCARRLTARCPHRSGIDLGAANDWFAACARRAVLPVGRGACERSGERWHSDPKTTVKQTKSGVEERCSERYVSVCTICSTGRARMQRTVG